MPSILRHVSLKECSMPTMVALIATLLRGLSLNVDPAYKKKIPIIFKLFTVVTMSCYFYVFLLSMIWFVFSKSVETGDIISASIVFALGAATEISTVKLIYMLFYQDSLRSMIEKYIIHDSKCMSNARFTKNQMLALKQVKRRAVIFWFVIIGNGLIYVMKPLLLPGRRLMEDIEFIYGLGPHLESPNYEIAYLLCLGGVTYICYATANISGFFIIVIGYIEAQMLSLSQELVNIWKDAQDYYKKNYETVINRFRVESDGIKKEKHIILNKYMKEQLQFIVNTHNTNKSFLSQIENVFRGAIAIEFALLISSLIAEFLGGLENTYLMMPFALTKVTMDCIIGQKLLDASIVFERAVYESNWENLDLDNMKTVLIILKNAQKNMTVSAGGLTKLDYMCLMSVGRLIYSTYTALRSTVNN